MTTAANRSATNSPTAGLLIRLADLAYRRRGRMVVAWLPFSPPPSRADGGGLVAILAAAVAVAPRLAGEFSGEFATVGSESQAAADLVAERFPGISGDTIEVVWQADAGVRDPVVLGRVARFLEQAESVEGVAAAQPPRVSRDGTIALARLELDRPALDVPDETGPRLIEMAEAASGDGLRIELGGPPIRNAQEGRADRGGDHPSSPSDRSSRSGCRSRSRSSGSGSRCC